MAHDVFVSYAAQDKAFADAVVATLEQEGIRCWVSPRDVVPGHDYGQDIVTAIHSARVVLLLLSSGANQSKTVVRELERAVSNAIPILPVRLEDVAPTGELTYFLSGAHWLDAITPPLEQRLRELADAVRLLLSTTAPVQRPATGFGPARPAVQDRQGGARARRGAGPSTRMLVLLGVVAVALVALVGLVVGMVVGGGGGGEEAGTTPSSEPPATSVDEGTDDGAITGGGGVALDSLTEGDCYAYADGGFVDVVACEEAHDGEVFAALVHPAGADAPYPGAGELDSYALEECTAAYAERAGRVGRPNCWAPSVWRPSWRSGRRGTGRSTASPRCPRAARRSSGPSSTTPVDPWPGADVIATRDLESRRPARVTRAGLGSDPVEAC